MGRQSKPKLSERVTFLRLHMLAERSVLQKKVVKMTDDPKEHE